MPGGRKKIPTKLHILNGNPSKITDLEKLEKKEPQYEKIDPNAEPPAWLSKDAKEEWARVAPQLVEYGLLTDADRTAFECYCEEYGKYRKAQRKLNRQGYTYSYITQTGQKKFAKRPEVQIVNDSIKLIKSFCAEFGLTPSSRSRMAIKTEEDDDDGMENLLTKSGM